MPMSCCHYSFWCNYRNINEEEEQDHGNNCKVRKNLNGKEERRLIIRK